MYGELIYQGCFQNKMYP